MLWWRSRVSALLVLVSVGCEGAVDPDVREPPPLPALVAAAYQQDAALLTLRDMAQLQPIQEAPVELPTASVAAYERALTWLYHSSGAARDSVVDLFAIHAWPTPELHEIVVTVDDTYAWTTRWRMGEALTGEPAIDQLVSTYQLSVLSWRSTGSDGASVLLSTPLSLNAAALGRSFVGIPGVRGGYPNVKGGGGNDITGEEQAGAWFLTFSRGWEDCLSGCQNRHSWRFRVSAEGVVEYLGSEGPDLPDGTG